MIYVSPTTRTILVLLAEFFIATCTAVAGAMAQAGQFVWPAPAVYLFGFLLGVVAGWKELKGLIQVRPEPNNPQ